MVRIKGADEPVRAHRLLGIGDRHRAVGRAESTLVGRRLELSAVEGLLDCAVDGRGGKVRRNSSPGGVSTWKRCGVQLNRRCLHVD